MSFALLFLDACTVPVRGHEFEFFFRNDGKGKISFIKRERKKERKKEREREREKERERETKERDTEG